MCDEPMETAGAGPTLAQRADPYRLYERAVQEPEPDAEFLLDVYREAFGRPARRLREDFCGTGALCRAWVALHPDNRAWGVDLDPEVLAWGRVHHVETLPAQERHRLELTEGDVRTVRHEPVDVVAAQNFSYFVFDTRRELVDYFRAAHTRLDVEGLLVLDAYGGPDASREMTEETEYDDFTYVWDQHSFDPVHQRGVCHIHFAFPDGSRLERAFSYEWRLYSLPEIREALEEAGFEEVTVYWEGTGEDGEGDGEYTPAEVGDADDAWVAYLVARKGSVRHRDPSRRRRAR